MNVDDATFKDTYHEWLQRALARDADRWAEVERELARLREKAQNAPTQSGR